MQIREQIKQVNIVLSGTLDLYRIWAKKHQLNYNAIKFTHNQSSFANAFRFSRNIVLCENLFWRLLGIHSC